MAAPHGSPVTVVVDVTGEQVLADIRALPAENYLCTSCNNLDVVDFTMPKHGYAPGRRYKYNRKMCQRPDGRPPVFAYICLEPLKCAKIRIVHACMTCLFQKYKH